MPFIESLGYSIGYNIGFAFHVLISYGVPAIIVIYIIKRFVLKDCFLKKK